MSGIYLRGQLLASDSVPNHITANFPVDILCLRPPSGISKGHAFVVKSSFGDVL